MKERQLGSATYPIGFMLVLKTDHITGAVGKLSTLKLTIAKSGQLTFSDAVGAIVEVGNGWYNWTPNLADRNILGELKLHVAETSCDPYDDKYDIVSYDPFAAVSLPVAERNALADTILTRDWLSTVAAVATVPARCLLQAARLLRNKWYINPASGVLTVLAEDGATTAWTMQTHSQVGADPIVGQTPS